jgi:Bacterial protein of unknown function (DUF885)
MAQPGRTAIVALLLAASSSQGESVPQDPARALAELFGEWRQFQGPVFHEGVPDYTAAAMDRQRRELPRWQTRLETLEALPLTTAQEVDLALIRAEMHGLEFDHRVLRPWSRNPCFYRVVYDAQSDTPSHEGPVLAGAIELWQVRTPVPAAQAAALRRSLQAIPRLLAQARANLVEDARDLWFLGIRQQRAQSTSLAAFGERLRPTNPELQPDVDRARAAVDDFRAWLETELPKKKGASGVGVPDYDWYLRHVDLRPFTWAGERLLMERELDRALANLALEEQRNRALPPLGPARDAESWQQSASQAVSDYMRFLRDSEIVTVTDDMEPALRGQIAPYLGPAERHFFAEVDMREPLLMRCHQFHWFDLARMAHRPHPDPIRRAPLLYNIWVTRAEGFATAMEEMMASAGLLDGRPRGRELMHVMIAQRAARALASLRLHSNEFTIEAAVRYASAHTPRGWLRPDGELVWGEQQLYLEQPGYGTSYLAGKAQVESLLAARARSRAFTLKSFIDTFADSGMIPVSLIRWEMTGEPPEAP